MIYEAIVIVGWCHCRSVFALEYAHLITPRAYAHAGLSNRLVLSVCRRRRLSYNFLKKIQMGDLEATTIYKEEVNVEIRDTLACLYLI